MLVIITVEVIKRYLTGLPFIATKISSAMPLVMQFMEMRIWLITLEFYAVAAHVK